MVFTYHHSHDEGWKAVAEAVLGAGFIVVNSQPVKAEMSVATPKAQAKEPIQLDIIVVCRKRGNSDVGRLSTDEAKEVARKKSPDFTRLGLNSLEMTRRSSSLANC